MGEDNFNLVDGHDGKLEVTSILDPFAGIGGIHALRSMWVQTFGVELEPEWASVSPWTRPGDAFKYLKMCRRENYLFDIIATSPTYGNRFADSHNAADPSVRRSYTHDLRAMTGDNSRKLHKKNSGTLYWGKEYREFHARAYDLFAYVAPMVWLNVSDFIKGGEVVRAAEWHKKALEEAGYKITMEIEVPTPRMGFGENGDARVEHEMVFVGQRRRVKTK